MSSPTQGEPKKPRPPRVGASSFALLVSSKQLAGMLDASDAHRGTIPYWCRVPERPCPHERAGPFPFSIPPSGDQAEVGVRRSTSS